MKKALIGVAVLVVLIIGGFFLLLGKASPENAPQDVKVIELPDTFEK